MKYLKALLASVLFVLLLAVIHFIHIRFFSVNVVFYAAIQDGVIAALICGVLLYLLKGFSIFNAFEKNALIVLWLLAGYAFAQIVQHRFIDCIGPAFDRPKQSTTSADCGQIGDIHAFFIECF